ncbi:MAG: 50S ribosomal protein L28 [Clostridia bacterium]|nr:50S ribosomal protein L28 [Clostridia bacterium]
MSRVCSVCGKGQQTGHLVSHSKIRTNRTFRPNVQKISYVKDGKVVTGYVCARCMKTIERA